MTLWKILPGCLFDHQTIPEKPGNQVLMALLAIVVGIILPVLRSVCEWQRFGFYSSNFLSEAEHFNESRKKAKLN